MGSPSSLILPFGLAGGANVKSAIDWSNDPTRLVGFVDGVADPAQVNTVLRQSSSVTAMIAQFIVDNAQLSVNDDGNLSAMQASYQAALLASVLTSPLLHPQVQQAYFTSPGVYNFTVPPYVTQLEIWVWGGGAGGGGAAANGAGSGGGGGGFCVGIFTVVPGTTYQITIGLGGAGGAAGNNPGTNGGLTSFGAPNATPLLYALGGTAGRGAASSITALGGPTYTPGGLGVGGSYQQTGEHGHQAFLIGSQYFGGPGGGSWSVQNTFFSDGAQQSGYGPGGGGSGGANSGAPAAGGSGLPGMSWVRWTI